MYLQCHEVSHDKSNFGDAYLLVPSSNDATLMTSIFRESRARPWVSVDVEWIYGTVYTYQDREASFQFRMPLSASR